MTTKDYFEYIKDNLKFVNDISFRKMMGEYLLYYKGCLIGGIYDNRLLIKKTEVSQNIFNGNTEVLPYEGAKTFMFEVDIEEDKNKIKELLK